MAIILVSLLPVYILYKYLLQVMKPRESAGGFLIWLLTVFALIFLYSFLLVFTIKRLFPGA